MSDKPRFIDAEHATVRHVRDDGTVIFIPATMQNADFRLLVEGDKETGTPATVIEDFET